MATELALLLCIKTVWCHFSRMMEDGYLNSMVEGVKRGIIVLDRGYCRMMTPLECERLQTVPESYTAGASQSQRYRMLGVWLDG